jgi:hypothetical protein
MTANPTVIALPQSSRKKEITHDLSFRVWRLHKRLNHTSLDTLAHMVKENLLGEVDVTYQEINLVDDHQDCYSCALSKWRALSKTVNSNLRHTLIGKSWSMDYKGPYAILALGGYFGKFVFVELSCGDCVVFLTKTKKNAIQYVRKVNLLCRRFGHVMETLRVDMGAVENSIAFLASCHSINNERGLTMQGLEINPANIPMPGQNPVERHIQTLDSHEAAITVDQDLLGSEF